MEYLELAFEEKAFRMATIGVEPLLDDLHGEPEFLRLVSRVGLRRPEVFGQIERP